MNLPLYTLFSNPLVFQVPIPKVCLCTQKAELRYCEGFWGSTLIMVSLSKSGATCTARACYVRAGTAGSVAVGASTAKNNENASLCWDPHCYTATTKAAPAPPRLLHHLRPLQWRGFKLLWWPVIPTQSSARKAEIEVENRVIQTNSRFLQFWFLVCVHTIFKKMI